MQVARWVTLMALVLFLPAIVRAQVRTGTDVLRGRVTTVDGAFVPEANVEVFSVETGIRRAGTRIRMGGTLLSSLMAVTPTGYRFRALEPRTSR